MTEVSVVGGLYDPGTGHLFVLGYSTDVVEVVDSSNGKTLNSYASPVGQSGGGLALDPSTGELWVTSGANNLAYLVTRSDGTILRGLDLGALGDPDVTGMVFDASGKIWARSNSHGVIYQLDPAAAPPVVPVTPVLTGITTVARHSTPANSSMASANVAQVIDLVGTGFKSSDIVVFPTRDGAGNESTVYVTLTAASGDGTYLQAVVPDDAKTGAVTVFAPRAVSNLGFNGNNDAVYRKVTVPFTATATSTALKFSDGGLQGLSDESWGLDNVRVLDSHGNLVYSTDFEQGAGPEWSKTTTDDTYPLSLTRFLNRFSNDNTTLTLSGLTSGSG